MMRWLSSPWKKSPFQKRFASSRPSFSRRKAATCDFTPAKQWKIFICPKVHNDIGYTDLQPHVNELDNRNTDTVLEVLKKYPFYKFNFETSWLVDNYLD